MKKGDKKDRNANANKFDLVSDEIQNVCCCFTTFKCKTNVR
jgi:hypothetical protein